MRSVKILLAIAVSAAAAECIGDSGGDGSYTGAEVDCTGLICDWTVKQGNPAFGPTWHEGDNGVDLSDASSPIVIELRDVLFANHNARQLNLRAVVVRDITATMAFEVDFYAPGQAPGETFWDRQPVFLATRHMDVIEHGAVNWLRSVLVPSEGAAVVLRVMKDGTGLAMFDELTLGP